MIERVEKNEHGGQRAGKVTLTIPSSSEWPVLHLGEEVKQAAPKWSSGPRFTLETKAG